jgi:hypothetical protein
MSCREFVLHLPRESLGDSEEWPNGPVRVRAEIPCSPELPLGDGSNDEDAVFYELIITG